MRDFFNRLFFLKGKTLLAKAVANQTSATFLRVVGSELIQKYLVISLKFYLFFYKSNN
jgi:AAA+ superfamily predicted ATPase